MIYIICDFKNVFFLSELERNVFGIDLRGDENISSNFSVIIVRLITLFFFSCVITLSTVSQHKGKSLLAG